MACFAIGMQAQRPVFKPENSRPVLDRLTYQFERKNLESGNMDEDLDKVAAYIKETLAEKVSAMDGFTVHSDTVVTPILHLHFDEEEILYEACDWDLQGHWLVDVEWPSAEQDPNLIMRKWISDVIRGQLEATFKGSARIVPFPGGSAEYRPMLDYYAGKYRRYWRDKKLEQKKAGEYDGPFAWWYFYEFNPVLFIRVRCISPQYVTFYVADLRPGYRISPSYYQQTLNRDNGKPGWLEDWVTEEKIRYIKQTIRDKCEPIEAEANLDDVIRNHDYCLAFTETGITLSFLPYTFNVIAGDEAFQYSFTYEEVL